MQKLKRIVNTVKGRSIYFTFLFYKNGFRQNIKFFFSLNISFLLKTKYKSSLSLVLFNLFQFSNKIVTFSSPNNTLFSSLFNLAFSSLPDVLNFNIFLDCLFRLFNLARYISSIFCCGKFLFYGEYCCKQVWFFFSFFIFSYYKTLPII